MKMINQIFIKIGLLNVMEEMTFKSPIFELC